jgi:hypothetical protein
VREDARRLAREEGKPAEGLARREDGTITGGRLWGGGTDAGLRELPRLLALTSHPSSSPPSPPPRPPPLNTQTPGTDADLRKLPHARAGELLRERFNMSEEEVAALGRWARIDAIRTKCR